MRVLGQDSPTLAAHPERLRLPLLLGQPAQAPLRLRNEHDRPLCFRIQSTNPTRHYVTPAYGILFANSTTTVTVDIDPMHSVPPPGQGRVDTLRVPSLWLPVRPSTSADTHSASTSLSVVVLNHLSRFDRFVIVDLCNFSCPCLRRTIRSCTSTRKPPTLPKAVPVCSRWRRT